MKAFIHNKDAVSSLVTLQASVCSDLSSHTYVDITCRTAGES